METLIFFLLNLLMIFTAHLAAFHYLQKDCFSEQLITTFLIYVSQVSISILFLGVIVRNLGMQWIVLLNAAISFFIIIILRRTIKKSFNQSYEKLKNFSREIIRVRDIFLYLFVFLFVLQVAALLVKMYYLPAYVWDAFSYHLHPVAEWVQQNMIPATIDSPVLRINRNPMGTRLLNFWCFWFTEDIRWIELPQFMYGLVTVLCSYSLLIKLNIKKNIALRYAILIFFIPLILIESRTGQDHLVLNGATLMSTLYFVNVFYEKKYSRIIFLSLALGLLLGTKISSPQIIFVLFLALLLSKGWNRNQVGEFLNTNKMQLGIGVLIILMIGGYWFLKSKLILNSYLGMIRMVFSLRILLIVLMVILLFFIVRKVMKKITFMKLLKQNKAIMVGLILLSLFLAGGLLISHLDVIKTVVLRYDSPTSLLQNPSFYADYPMLKALPSRFLKNILSFPFRIKDIGHYTTYTPDFLEKSGFGIQFFGFGLLAYFIIFIFCLVKKSYRTNIVGFILIFSLVLLASYFFYYYTAANYRMFMFFPVFGIILWAVLYAGHDFPGYFAKLIDLLILIMILFNFSVCFFEGNMDHNRWKTLFTINNPLERTSVKYSPFFNKKAEAWEFIDMYMTSRDSLGYMGHYDSWVFPYYDNQLERKIYHLPSIPGFQLNDFDAETQRLEFNPEFIENLRQRNIRFIHINPQGARHYKKYLKNVIINDERIFQVTTDLYYFKW